MNSSNFYPLSTQTTYHLSNNQYNLDGQLLEKPKQNFSSSSESFLNPGPQNVFNQIQNRNIARLSSFESYKEHHTNQNIKEVNYTKTILKAHGKPITTFDINEDQAVTCAGKTIKLWNLKTGECQWTYGPPANGPSLKIDWKSLKIINDQIVCTGRTSIAEDENEEIENTENDIEDVNSTVVMLDLKTGKEKATIKDPRIDANKVCLVGQKIFCLLAEGEIGEWNGTIGEWNLDGKLIREIPSDKFSIFDFVTFLGSENYLVHISDEAIMIHDLLKNRVHRLDLKDDIDSTIISSAHIDDDQLVCGFDNNTKQRNNPDCCVIDLKTGDIKSQYQATGAFTHTMLDRFNQPYSTEEGSIEKIIGDKATDHVYLGHSTGQVVAVDWNQNSHKVLGQHRNAVEFLALEGQILVSGSQSDSKHPAEIKFWDIKDMKPIGELNLPSLNKLSFQSKTLYAAVGKTFTRWIYELVTHVGEELSSGSALEMDNEFHSDCYLQ